MSMSVTPLLKVLHVDDCEDFLFLFQESFGEQLNVTSVQSAESALDKMREEDFDAVITDFELTGMTGLDLLKCIKKDHPTVPVIFYTGQGNEDVAREAFVTGASDYFVKNVNEFLHKEKLLNSIRSAIEKRNAEIALKESERKYKFLYDESQAINIVMDLEGKIISANRACLKLMDCTEEELIGRSAFDCVVPEQREKVIESFTRDIQGEQTASMMMDVVSFSGKIKKVLFGAGASLITDEHGNPTSSLVGGIDVTSMFLVEEKLNKTKKELLRINKELSDFAFMVSHDFKTKLTMIMGFLQLINKSPDNIDRYYDRLWNILTKMSTYNDKLLKLARAGQVIEEKKRIPTQALIRSVFDELKPTDRDVELVFASEIPEVHGDPARLEQVFYNIINNAFEHSGNHRKLIIEVKGEVDNDSVAVHIIDNGNGIEPGDLDKIFKAGFSLKKDDNGSGFGLATVKKIVEAHDGRIWAENDGKNNGMRISLKLPIP